VTLRQGFRADTEALQCRYVYTTDLLSLPQYDVLGLIYASIFDLRLVHASKLQPPKAASPTLALKHNWTAPPQVTGNQVGPKFAPLP
jgi:hypothetical protein